uniref:Chromodomain helicase DNA binding protein 8 n=1 Tax=Astyanax mexicanus TaxID=7994 RepID=A0A8B9LS63_ASTMX
MADPIMDLFDDTPLFNLDSLPEDAFSQGSSDPVEEALKLALGQVDPPVDLPVDPPVDPPVVPLQTQQTTHISLAQAVSISPAPVTVQAVPQTSLPVATSSGAPTTVLLSSPLGVPVSGAQVTTQQLAAVTQQTAGQTAPKIVILKGPQGQAQVLQSVGGNAGSPGKLTIARVLTGTPLRPGMSIVSGGTVLNAAQPVQGQVKVGTGVQRLVQTPNGPVKQVLMTTLPQTQTQVQIPAQTQLTQPQPAQVQTQVQLQTQAAVQAQGQGQAAPAGGATATVRPQGITLATVPQQGEAKRITLVLQQPAQGGAAQAGAVTLGSAPAAGAGQQGQQPRLVLGSLPGKLVLQGGQLAALTQARTGQTGAQPKVLTIQLQVQQQPNQQGAKFQLVSGAPGAGGSPQVVQISQGQGGQRLAVPLKLLLQPQTSSASGAGAVSVVKVINTSAGSATSPGTTATVAGVRVAKAPDSVRKVESLCKQEKANRIVAEAIARAKARGERNIPRVLNQDELPAGQTSTDQDGSATPAGAKKKSSGGSKKKSPTSGAAGKSVASGDKKVKVKTPGSTVAGGAGGSGSKSKSKTKPNTITLVGIKKRKRNPSSDHSDGELSPPASPRTQEEDLSQMRRSNRQVKRKKYTEDLDIKITDDEDEPEEEVDVTTPAVVTTGLPQPVAPELQGLEGDGLPSMQFFVENPSEEDAAIVDKILSMRLTKKEVSQGHYITVEEFFVKYKNYSYLHCEWASMEQLERDKRIHQKLKRFKTKQAQMRRIFQEVGAEEKIVAELRAVYDPSAPDFHLQALVRSAGKLVLLDKLLPRLKAGGHKVLIFSQMVRCLDILEDYLIHKRYLYERIDGRVRGNLRQAAIDRFSKLDSDRFVFLLCTRAGGLGINLTAADTCVIFDSDWNPQNDLQAQARCHRIGQSKAVKVYRLITRNSYEREMLDKASLKLGLDRAVLQSMSGSKDSNVNGIQQFSKKEIEDLLRKGAYAAIMDENDEGSRFCEEDIDQILQRRATTITIESEGKGSTFSKASFVASENRTDIALDDPEFWQKWAKKADLDLDSINRKNTLVIDTPRVRKQTRQFSTLRGDGGDLSDMDSDDEYPPHNSRQARASRRSDRHAGGGYGRTDCFRVEKHLLIYGWGRWRDILGHARCKRRLGEKDVETICRVILVFCLLHYRGDENIKSFIWQLITPPENGQEPHSLLNHSGLSIPVPRGRKGKRVKTQSSFDVQKVEWIRKYNPETLLLDESYRKHLKHQCNKVLLRVRMLYYLKQEVIGEHADAVLRGVDGRDIDIWLPEMEQQDVPTAWWNAEADRCLLLGVYKHGYEMYTTMRADPCLCFLERCGRPDDQEIKAEQHAGDAELGDGPDFDKYSEDPEFRPMRHGKDMFAETDSRNADEICVDDHMNPMLAEVQASTTSTYWPSSSSLTARLRRLVTAYQRSYRREQLKIEAAEKGDRRRRRCEQASKLKEIARQERQQRWTRREECDFYRVVSTFGVERIKSEEGVQENEETRLDWARFRTFARLDKKTDESLSRYFRCFVAMCRRVCHLRPAPGEESQDLSQSLAPITEERASRTLYRISLLCRLRERILPHPSLEERLSLAPPSSDLPRWWSIPQHDHELLLGAVYHGVSRTEQSIFPDPQFSFSQARQDYLQNQQTAPAVPVQTHSQTLEKSSVKEERLDEEARLLGMETICQSDSLVTPLSYSKGEGGGPFGWSWKKSRGSKGKKVRDTAGGEQSDSDSDSDSDSSTSSHRSGSSDDSGDILSTAPLKMCDVDEENSTLSFTPSQDGALPESVSETHRVDWPKDRVLINRIDNLCNLVLTGHWQSGRRYTTDPQLTLPSDEHGLGDDLNYARVSRRANTTLSGEAVDGQESEFTVKLLKEEGLKLTFSKQALLPNGSPGEASSRRKRKDLELFDSGGGLHAPRKRDLPNWLKENPDYAVEGDMLEMLVNRTKRKRRKKRIEKGANLTGIERVKVIDMRTGKKYGGIYGPALQDLKEYLEENPDHAVAPEWADAVRSSGFLPEGYFHRLLTLHTSFPKKSHHYLSDPSAQSDPLLGAVETETLVSDGAYMMDDEDLDGGDLTSSHHFLTSAYDVKMEAGSLDMDGGDGLSQGGYDSSDREAILDDVIMAPKNTDSSSSSED